MDYWRADFGQREERGRKGRFARSIEGGMEEERSQLLPPPRCCITRRRRMGEKNERMRGRKKQEQPRGRNAGAAALRSFVPEINGRRNTYNRDGVLKVRKYGL